MTVVSLARVIWFLSLGGEETLEDSGSTVEDGSTLGPNLDANVNLLEVN